MFDTIVAVVPMRNEPIRCETLGLRLVMLEKSYLTRIVANFTQMVADFLLESIRMNPRWIRENPR